MSLSEKRKQLEDIRAAREAKQRVVSELLSSNLSKSICPPLSSLKQPFPTSTNPTILSTCADTGAIPVDNSDDLTGSAPVVGHTEAPSFTMSSPVSAIVASRLDVGGGTYPPICSPHGCSSVAVTPQAPSGKPTSASIRNGYDLLYRDFRVHVDEVAPGRVSPMTVRWALSPKLIFGAGERAVLDVATSVFACGMADEEGSTGVMSALSVMAAYSTLHLCSQGDERTPGDYYTSPCGSDVGMAKDNARMVCKDENGGHIIETHSETGTAWQASGTPCDTLAVARSARGLVLVWTFLPTVSSLGSDSAGTGLRSVSTSSMEEFAVMTPLICDTEVTVVCLHPFRPGVVLAGTRCGRIVSWCLTTEWAAFAPTRRQELALATTGTPHLLLASALRPISSSFPSPLAHRGPVLQLCVRGDASCHRLHSISTEGRVCAWPASRPLHPTDSLNAFLGDSPLGNVCSAASFSASRGADTLGVVFVGTSSGYLLEGNQKDNRALELRFCVNRLDTTAADKMAVTASMARPLTSPSSANAGKSMMSRMSLPTVAPVGASQPPPPTDGVVTVVAVQPTFATELRGRAWVLYATSSGACCAWDGETLHPLQSFVSPVSCMVWSATSPNLFAVGEACGCVSLWNVTSSLSVPIARRELGAVAVQAYTGSASTVAFVNPFGEGDELLHGALTTTNSQSFSVGVGTSMTGVTSSDEGHTAVVSLHFSADGHWLFAGMSCGLVYTVELSDSLHKN